MYRMVRFGHVFFKLCFFIFITSMGYILMRDEKWLPWFLGGSGDERLVLLNYPFENVNPKLAIYYRWQLGYHLHSLIYQMNYRNRPDFMEMVLHHVATVFLVFFSYWANGMQIGAIVFLLHDFTDIFSYFIKTVIDTQLTPLIVVAYASLLSSWGFYRLFAYPYYILSLTMYKLIYHADLNVDFNDISGYYLMNGLLSILLCLHYYWYSLFLGLGMNYIRRGQMKDGVADGFKSKQKSS